MPAITMRQYRAELQRMSDDHFVALALARQGIRKGKSVILVKWPGNKTWSVLRKTARRELSGITG